MAIHIAKSYEELLLEIKELEFENYHLKKLNDANKATIEQAVINEYAKDFPFQKLTSNISDLVFQFTRRPDGTYCVPIASEGIINIFGCKPEDVHNNFEAIAKVLYPEDVERVINDIEYSAKHISHFTCEFRVQIPGKPIQWIFSRSVPELLADGSVTWYGFNADITNMKLAQNAIEQSEKRFKTMFEDAPLGIALIDSVNGTIYQANPMYAKIAGRTMDDIYLINCMNLTHQDDIGNELINMDKLICGEINGFQMEKRYIRPNGSHVWINMTISHLIKEDNMPLRHLCMIEDITHRKHAAEKLQKIAWSQNHEIRAPLTSIMSIINVMNFKISLEGKLELLGKLEGLAKQLDAAIHKIVDETQIGKQ